MHRVVAVAAVGCVDHAVETFERLHAEGADRPVLMSLGLHLRIIGRPGRIGVLEKFIAHVRQRGDVWCATRLEIARAFAAAVPPPAGLSLGKVAS